jgi:hypothetical protein
MSLAKRDELGEAKRIGVEKKWPGKPNKAHN